MAIGFMSLYMIMKLVAVLILIPFIIYGINYIFNKADKKDNRWSLEDIKGNALATSIYAAGFVMALYIFFGLVIAGALVGIMG